MTRTEYNGKPYEMGTKPAYPSKPGDVFYDSEGTRFELTEEYLPKALNLYWGHEKRVPTFPLYQAIEVREPELLLSLKWSGASRFLRYRFEPVHPANEYIYEYLDEAVTRALKAEKVVITMPDGVEQSWTKVGDWRHDHGNKIYHSWDYQQSMLASHIEQALIAGRRVQIEEGV